MNTMRMNTMRKQRWAKLLAAFAMLMFAGSGAWAQGDDAKPAKPKSKTLSTTKITAVAPNSITIATKAETIQVNLTPTTEVLKEERDLAAGELKVGDMVKFSVKGANGMGVVKSLSPLVINIEDTASLTIQNTDGLDFDRHSPLKTSDLAVDQNVYAKMTVQPDGKIEANVLRVIIAKPKQPRAPKAKKEE